MHPIKLQIKKITQNTQGSNLFVRNKIKEYLQDIILSIIYNNPDLKNLIFYGGSCLKKIYGLNRLSQDLDFESTKKIDIDHSARIIADWFQKENFNSVDIHTQSSQKINRITVKFQVLYDLNLSAHQDEKLHVKVEVNDNPPGKYQTRLTPYHNDKYSMMIRHYKLETLMAGKMVACLQRVFKKGDTGIEIKGRDYYDLIWYMKKGISPDPARLKDSGYTTTQAFNKLDQKIEKIKPRDLKIDLDPLFPSSDFVQDWCNSFHDLYQRYRK